MSRNEPAYRMASPIQQKIRELSNIPENDCDWGRVARESRDFTRRFKFIIFYMQQPDFESSRFNPIRSLHDLERDVDKVLEWARPRATMPRLPYPPSPPPWSPGRKPPPYWGAPQYDGR